MSHHKKDKQNHENEKFLLKQILDNPVKHHLFIAGVVGSGKTTTASNLKFSLEQIISDEKIKLNYATIGFQNGAFLNPAVSYVNFVANLERQQGGSNQIEVNCSRANINNNLEYLIQKHNIDILFIDSIENFIQPIDLLRFSSVLRKNACMLVGSVDPSFLKTPDFEEAFEYNKYIALNIICDAPKKYRILDLPSSFVSGQGNERQSIPLRQYVSIQKENKEINDLLKQNATIKTEQAPKPKTL